MIQFLQERALSHYFPLDYEHARREFRNKARPYLKHHCGVFISRKVPSQLDSDLTIDGLYIPPSESCENLVIVSSGVHGPEGYVGSALQGIILDKVLPRLDLKRMGVLLLHSLNPYGFKYHRRQTENNVDLNRNFDLRPEHFRTYNKGYEKVMRIVQPEGVVESFNGQLLKSFVYLGSLLALGDISLDEMAQALGGGQFGQEQGLHFGGKEPEPQVHHVHDIFQEYGDDYKSILLLDIHSGLGEWGSLHLMPNLEAHKGESFQRIIRRHRDRHIYKVTTGDTEGFYHTHGDFIEFPSQIFPDKEVMSCTVEFGTLGNNILAKLRTINRIILENQGHHYGHTTDEIKREVQKKFLELFYPNSPIWKQIVAYRGMKFFQRMMYRYGQLVH